MVQGALPCTSETPVICTPLPFFTVYPKVGCCETLDSVKKPKKEADGDMSDIKDIKDSAEAPAKETMVRE